MMQYPLLGGMPKADSDRLLFLELEEAEGGPP